MTDQEPNPEDWKVQRAMAQCDAFWAQKKAWGAQNPQKLSLRSVGREDPVRGLLQRDRERQYVGAIPCSRMSTASEAIRPQGRPPTRLGFQLEAVA